MNYWCCSFCGQITPDTDNWTVALCTHQNADGSATTIAARLVDKITAIKTQNWYQQHPHISAGIKGIITGFKTQNINSTEAAKKARDRQDEEINFVSPVLKCIGCQKTETQLINENITYKVYPLPTSYSRIFNPTHVKCNDCRKHDAKIYTCIFCEAQELLLDNEEDSKWLYKDQYICQECIDSYLTMLRGFYPPIERSIFLMRQEAKEGLLNQDSQFDYSMIKAKAIKLKQEIPINHRGTSMLYLHYEDIQIIDPNTNAIKNLTCFIFSAYSAAPEIYGKENFANMKDILVWVKGIPSGERAYDPVTHIWTIPKEKLSPIITLAQVKGYISDKYVVNHKNLKAFINGIEDRVKSETKPMAAEDFFYTYGQPQTSTPVPKEQVALKLEAMLKLTQPDFVIFNAEQPVLLKLYRKTALLLHPDRNSGDGSKMSELNMLWQMYNQKPQQVNQN